MTKTEAARFMGAGFVYSLPYDRVIPVKKAIMEVDNNYLLLCRDSSRDYYFTDPDAIRMSDKASFVRQEATKKVEQTFNVAAGATATFNFSF